MSEEKKPEAKKIAIGEKDSGFVILEFTKEWGTKEIGDTETYHVSTANALVYKAGVAKVKTVLKKYVPKKEVK
jgi:hypothetical protein